MIDHIFMLIDPQGPAIDRLAQLGLAETYRRTHPGQGTRNVFYCFDNMFLELLWVDDPDAALSPMIRRTGLYERSLRQTTEVCPFGIAWRPSPFGAEPAIQTWAFSPPYLPCGMTIAVAEDSDDFRQPMIFRSPGSAPPIEWPHEKRGDLQRGRGLGAVREIVLTMPDSIAPCAALNVIAAECQPSLTLKQGSAWHLQMQIERLDGRPDLVLGLPD